MNRYLCRLCRTWGSALLLQPLAQVHVGLHTSRALIIFASSRYTVKTRDMNHSATTYATARTVATSTAQKHVKCHVHNHEGAWQPQSSTVPALYHCNAWNSTRQVC